MTRGLRRLSPGSGWSLSRLGTLLLGVSQGSLCTAAETRPRSGRAFAGHSPTPGKWARGSRGLTLPRVLAADLGAQDGLWVPSPKASVGGRVWLGLV